jgi:hypothetical protein
MSKYTDIFFCVLYGSLLFGLGWLVFTVSQLEPKPSEDAKLVTAIPARRVKLVIYRPEVGDNVDKTIICGRGGDDVYEPRGPTMFAGAAGRSC